jgi:dTDP-4-amino-4,6-dideoxygalactose transaminase
MKMISSHGQKVKYQHDIVGVNSRLDTLQAAILQVKLKYLDEYTRKRIEVASYYDMHLAKLSYIETPFRSQNSTHVFHQYTIKTKGIDRDQFKKYLSERNVPSMIYYHIPLHLQKAYRQVGFWEGSFPVTEKLSKTVLSLPIHTEMTEDELSYICEVIKEYNA